MFFYTCIFFTSLPFLVLANNNDPTKFIQLSLAVSKSAYLPLDGEKFIQHGHIIENQSPHHSDPTEDKISCKVGGWIGLGHENKNTELVLFKNVKQKLAIFGFRGTEDLDDWWDNFHFRRVDAHLGQTNFSLHEGFKGCFKSVSAWFSAQYKQIPLDYTKIITGHSLGGAQATIAAAYMAGKFHRRPDAVITFGSPKVGDDDFQEYYRKVVGCDRTIRMVNHRDIVDNVPPDMGYEHVCSSTNVNGGAHALQFGKAHSLYEGYEPGIRKKHRNGLYGISYGCDHPMNDKFTETLFSNKLSTQ